MIWLQCSLFVGFFLVSVEAKPKITAISPLTLRKDETTDSANDFIQVTGTSVTCVFEATPTVPFTKELIAMSGGYLIVVAHNDGSALTASDYTVSVKCTDSSPQDDVLQVTVQITTAPNTVVENVDVNKVYLPGEVLHTVSVPGLSTPVSCTATPPTHFSVVENDCTIRNDVDLRTLTLTSVSMDIDVSDGVETVTVTRVLSFLNPNPPPAFSSIPTEKPVSEDVPPGTTLVSFPATDNGKFTRSITVDRDLFLFDINDKVGIVTLASQQSFDYESGASYIITCIADDGYKRSTASVTLSLADANDAPTLTPASVTLSVKETPAGSLTLDLPFTVEDQDGVNASSHRFSVNPDKSYSDYFSFPDPYKLQLTNLLDLHLDTVKPAFPATITIVATDVGGKTATAEVVVQLEDANNYAPEFDTSSLSMSKVYVGMPQDTVLGQVEATDADTGTNAEIEFSLVEPNPHPGLFSVLANGQVLLLKDLTEPHGTLLSLEVKATDKGSPPMSTPVSITLQWNEAPSITNLPANAKVLEKPAAETSLITVKTSDPEGDTVTLEVTNVSPTVTGSGAFVVRGDEVVYTADEPLDRSATEFFDVTVTASDGYGGTSSGTLKVEIAPNLPPTSSCVGSEQASVNVQTAKVNSLVKTLIISDPEKDPISYTVTSTPPSGLFSFNEGKKQVVVAQDLKQESTLTHEVKVDISDGYSTVTCVVIITLTNNLPVFAPKSAEVSVREDVAPMVPFFTFDITHSKSFVVQWKVDPSSGDALFNLDDTTREISLASGQSLDYEQKTKEYIITCTADDTFGQSSSSVTVKIEDVNEAPKLPATTVHVEADEGPANTIVIGPRYDADDPDGDALKYVLDAAFTTLFSIDSSNGELTNLQDLDRDDGNPDQLTVKVHVRDPDGLSVTADVIIQLQDVNDNDPEFAQPKYTFEVGLSSKAGLLGTLVATDKDDGDNARVDIALDSSSPKGYLRLEPGGQLFLAKDMDLKYGTLITAVVEATDNGKPKRTGTVDVEFIWKPGPTIDNLPDMATIREDAQNKEEVFKVEVSKGALDQYLCVSDGISPKTKAFVMEEVSDKDFRVFYAGSPRLSASSTSQYVLTVRCYDDNGEDVKQLTIKVEANVPPVLTCDNSVQVDATATGADATVYAIKASDADPGDTLEYSINSQIFYVGESSGFIKAVDDLRKTTTEEESMTVKVKDTYDHETSCIIKFFLTNVNRAPEFTNLDHTVDIIEHPAAGTILYTVTVDDPNIFGTNIWYTLESDDKHKFVVTVAGREITVKLAPGEDLDYESNERTFVLKFTASDGYLDSVEGTLTIQVLQKNEPPYYENNLLHYTATFDEISTPREAVYLGCSVKDPDENDVVTLTVEGQHAKYFSIESKTSCELSLIYEYDLDEGLPNPVKLELVATDSHGETAKADLDITVNPINDNDPIFNGSKTLEVASYTPIGGKIGNAGATDKDIGSDGSLTYTATETPQKADGYITFQSSGDFILTKDMEGVFGPGEEFKYVLEATDEGNPARKGTGTVYVVYNPLLTTTPAENTTTTQPTTTEVPSTTAAEENLWENPIVIGLLAAVGALALIVLGICAVLANRYFCQGQSTDPYETSTEDPPPKNRNSRVSPISNDYYRGAPDGRMITDYMPAVSDPY